MDILAPVFAYLTCVAGIIGAFVVAISIMFSSPNQPVTAERGEVAAVVSATKTAPLVDLKKPALRSAAADNSAVNHVATATQNRENTQQSAATRPLSAQASASAAAAQKLAAGDPRAKGKITRQQWREMVQQERRRRLAYQQNADFDSRFLGYAD
jgi:hypothetical protein